MSLNKFQCIAFDMDGVITDTMGYHYRIWRRIFHEEGVPVRRQDIYAREGQKGIESVRELFMEYGKPFTFKKGREVLARKEKLFKGEVAQRFIPGSRSLVRDLTKKGLVLALVTGTSRHELKRILPQHIQDRFSVIVTGSDVKKGKPHPEPYLKAIKALNMRPEQAVVIENAPLGIRSAKAAGLKCFAIATSLSKDHLKKADRIFKNMKELREYLLQ